MRFSRPEAQLSGVLDPVTCDGPIVLKKVRPDTQVKFCHHGYGHLNSYAESRDLQSDSNPRRTYLPRESRLAHLLRFFQSGISSAVIGDCIRLDVHSIR